MITTVVETGGLNKDITWLQQTGRILETVSKFCKHKSTFPKPKICFLWAVGGILSGSSSENPFWWNANHVFVPYCTSDSWSGLKPSHPRTGMFSFMGAAVVQQVVKDILQLGLENSTDLLLAGKKKFFFISLQSYTGNISDCRGWSKINI